MDLPRGMKDFDGEEMFKIKYVRENFVQTANLFGFRFMDPSPIELLSTLETKSGPGIKDDIYYFKDKHDREVGLRFDFTMGLTRYVVSQKSLKLPAKLASFGGVYRYDEPQKGRYRFFHQWNIEIFGKPSLAADAELIEFTSRLFEKLQLKNIIIDISHRKLVESYVTSLFQTDDPKIISEIFRAMDKVQKKRPDEILAEYHKKGIDKEKLEKILAFSAIKGTPEEIQNSFDASSLDGWDELKQLYLSLTDRDVKNIRINFGIVRGLDYYSGMVFEAFDTSSDLGALVGGGRYDTLPKAFGRDDLGATGVAGGVERIILSLESQGIAPRKEIVMTSVLYANDEMHAEALAIASKLRQIGVPTTIDYYPGKALKKQMESSSESKFAIIVGPKEFAENKVVLRNMQDRSEKQISIDELIENAGSILKKP
ncbi:MAG: histidyl-tRNA synthetase [Thaumarchaeota archaeon CSP1-1]|nr:MAG: histidyl-tRNA synthetase [Thaumarchaeota archaeon CSP1-1]